MDYVIAIALTPILLICAKTNAQILLMTLVFGNPFTILLLFIAVEYIQINLNRGKSITFLIKLFSRFTSQTHSPSHDYIDTQNSWISSTNLCKACQGIYGFTEKSISRKISYFRLWLLSTHATLLYCFSHYNLSSLQFSFAEWNTLSLPYIILLIMIINLRYSINKIKQDFHSQNGPRVVHSATRSRPVIEIHGTNSSVASYIDNDNDATEINNHDDVANWLRKIDASIVYERLLLDPYLSLRIWRTNVPKAKLDTVPISKEEDVDNHDAEGDRSSYLNDSDFASIVANGSNENRNIIRNCSSLLSSISRITPRYLLMCNVLHLIIMLTYSYMNITFACASQIMTRHLSSIIVPVNCNYIFDEETNRIDRKSVV